MRKSGMACGLTLALALSFTASAHGPNQNQHSDTGLIVEFIGPVQELKEEQVHRLIEESHHLVDGNEAGPFLKRWAEAFNLKRRFIDGYRMASATGESPVHNLVVDSLLLFGLSHALEVGTGPTVLAFGAAHEWPGWLLGMAAAGGVAISVPGLDPLCMLVFATYAKSPGFRDIVGYARLAIVRPIKGTWNALHMNEVLRLFRSNRQPWLPGLYRVESLGEGRSNFYFSLGPASDRSAAVEIHSVQDKVFLHAVELKPEARKSVELKRWTQPLGWNARDFILHADRTKPYIRHYEKRGEFLRIELLDNAIPIRDGSNLIHNSCARLLEESATTSAGQSAFQAKDASTKEP